MREVCPKCERPTNVCLCDYFKEIKNKNKITVLRFEKEKEHALNTVNILKNMLTNFELQDGEKFEEIKKKNLILVYPREDSMFLEENLDKYKDSEFLFLDGTWKKTNKIFFSNEWLQALPKVTFKEAPASQYKLRKANKENSLSTLEAVSYLLEKIQDKDFSDLNQVQKKMIELQSQFMG